MTCKTYTPVASHLHPGHLPGHLKVPRWAHDYLKFKHAGLCLRSKSIKDVCEQIRKQKGTEPTIKLVQNANVSILQEDRSPIHPVEV